MKIPNLISLFLIIVLPGPLVLGTDIVAPLDAYLVTSFSLGGSELEADVIYQRGSQIYLVPGAVVSEEEGIVPSPGTVVAGSSHIVPPPGIVPPQQIGIPPGVVISPETYSGTVIEVFYPTYLILTTEKMPEEGDRILYAEGKYVADYEADPEDAWIYSYEFGGQINVANLPWVYVSGMGYIYPLERQEITLPEEHPGYGMRWCYSSSLGWFYNVAKSYPWIVDDDFFFVHVEWGVLGGTVDLH